MQDYLDTRLEEIKILANFELSRESEFLGTSVYNFYFHVWVKSNQRD